MTDYVEPDAIHPKGFYDPASRPHAVPTPGIFDDPSVCFKLNVEWRGHIIQMLERLLYPDAWDGDVDTRFRAQQEIFELILATIEGNCTVGELACCPVTIIEQHDTTITNIDNDIDISGGDINNVTNNTWNYDSSPKDLDRDFLLCIGLEAFMRQMIDTSKPIIERRNEGIVDTLRDLSDSLTFSNFLLDVLVLTGAATVNPALPVAIIMGKEIVDKAAEWLDVEEEIYLDPDLPTNLACCMYNKLKGQNPTFQNWCDAIVGCIWTGPFPFLEAALTATLCSERLYFAFLEALAVGIDAVEVLGQYVSCPCDPCDEYTTLINTYGPNGSVGVPAGTEFFNSSTGVTSWLFGAERVAFPLTERGCLGQVHILMANGANEIPPGGSVWAMVGGSTVEVRQGEFLSWGTGQIGTSPYGFGIPNQPGDALILWATDDTDPEGTKIPFAVTRFTEPNGDPALRHFIKP